MVKKRDGRTQEFDEQKIYSSLVNANKQSKEVYTEERLKELSKAVLTKLSLSAQEHYDADEIYDTIVNALTQNKAYSLLRAFIDFREERDDERQSNSKLMKTISKIVKETTKDNANIINGPSAKMLQIGSESSKWYNLNNMPKHIAKAHIEGKIHIHDLDYYEKTANCLQIPLGKILSQGFHTGIGFIRPPKRILTATALAAILLQASQNDLYGGQAYSHFDRDMAQFIPKEYEEAINCLRNQDNISEVEKKQALETILRVKNEVYQAMEALIHNLNSMKSRAGGMCARVQ
jgi:ribonucleoside-triphosphate reductase